MTKAHNSENFSLNYSLVIPAGGIGQRMLEKANPSQAPVAKQFLMLHGRTVLEHSVQAFLDDHDCQHIYIAVADSELEAVKAMFTDSRVHIVRGGKTRMQSVLAGLNALHGLVDEESWVMVHDAARANVYSSDVQKLKKAVSSEAYGGILATPAKDTLKRVIDNNILETLDRTTVWLALTPQMFRLGKLFTALNQAILEEKEITDEASAMEYIGAKTIVVEGRSDNIKLTYSEDILILKELLRNKSLTTV